MRAHNSRLIGVSATALLALATSVQAQPAAEQAGVTAAAQTVTRGILPVTGERTLEVGLDVFRFEQVVTNETGTAQLLFLDSSTLTVQPNSTVVIDEFVFDPATDTGRLTLSTAAGAFRFFGGQLSEQGAVNIDTPIATIGIRGSIVDFRLDADGLSVEGHQCQGLSVDLASQDGPPLGFGCPEVLFMGWDGSFVQGRLTSPAAGPGSGGGSGVGGSSGGTPDRSPDDTPTSAQQDFFESQIIQNGGFDPPSNQPGGNPGGGDPGDGDIAVLRGFTGGTADLSGFPPLITQGGSPRNPNNFRLDVDAANDTVNVKAFLDFVTPDGNGAFDYQSWDVEYKDNDPSNGFGDLSQPDDVPSPATVHNPDSFAVPILSTDGYRGQLSTHDIPLPTAEDLGFPSGTADPLNYTDPDDYGNPALFDANFDLVGDDSPLVWGHWAATAGGEYDQGFWVAGEAIVPAMDVPANLSLAYEGSAIGLVGNARIATGTFDMTYQTSSHAGAFNMNFDGIAYGGPLADGGFAGSDPFVYTGTLNGAGTNGIGEVIGGATMDVHGTFYNAFDDTAGGFVFSNGSSYHGGGVFGGERVP